MGPQIFNKPWKGVKCNDDWAGGACSACPICNPQGKCLKWCNKQTGRMPTIPLERKCASWWNIGACTGCDFCVGVEAWHPPERRNKRAPQSERMLGLLSTDEFPVESTEDVRNQIEDTSEGLPQTADEVTEMEEGRCLNWCNSTKRPQIFNKPWKGVKCND